MMEIFERFPEGKKKCFTISFDDNIRQDFRLVDKMEKYGIKGTFNIIPGWFSQEGKTDFPDPTYINITEKEALELYNNPLVEVANHGNEHGRGNHISSGELMLDTMKCKSKLESMYKKPIRGYAYPYGIYSEEYIDILKKAGIVYARTVNDSCNFMIPNNWLALKPTCHYANEKIMDYLHKFLNDEIIEDAYLFYVWGHTYEFDRMNNEDMFDKFLEEVSGRDDIWYATNIEVCDYDRAFKSLEFSADMTMVYNPSALDVYFQDFQQNMYCVKAGETKVLVDKQ